MASVKKSVLIEHTTIQMFDLVDKVEDYPKFLPWCGGSELMERTETITRARIDINYHGIKAHFTTENTKERPHTMLIRLVDGPFRQLEGSWRFVQLGDSACKVEFDLQYEFSNKLIEKVVGPVFGHIANTFVDSFVKRADQLAAGGLGK